MTIILVYMSYPFFYLPVRFEYVKPCFGQFIVPAVPDGHEWTGDRVKSLTSQGMDLYIRCKTLIQSEVHHNFCICDSMSSIVFCSILFVLSQPYKYYPGILMG